MTAQVIQIEERRGGSVPAPPNPLVEALDALGVALAGHKHVWTDRERMLYETALSYLGLVP